MPSSSVFVQARYRRSIYIGAFASRIQLRGALRVEGDVLTLDYRERWRSPITLRMVEGKPQRVSAPCASLGDIEIVPRLLGGQWLTLREVAFEALRAWPGARNGVCRFHVVGATRQAVAEATSELALAVAESQLRIAERSADEAER